MTSFGRDEALFIYYLHPSARFGVLPPLRWNQMSEPIFATPREVGGVFQMQMTEGFFFYCLAFAK